MSEEKGYRIGKVGRELNVGIDRIVEFLSKAGASIEKSPNAKLSESQYQALTKEFGGSDAAAEKREVAVAREAAAREAAARAPQPPARTEPGRVTTEAPRLSGTTVLGKVEFDSRGNVIRPKPAPAPAPAPTPAPAPAAKVEAPAPTARVAPPAPQAAPPAAPPAAPAPQAPAARAAAPQSPAAPPTKPEPAKAAPAPAPAAAQTPPPPAAPTPPPTVQPTTGGEEMPIELIEAKGEQLKGLTVLGKIDLSGTERGRGGKPGSKPGPGGSAAGKRERKRIKPVSGGPGINTAGPGRPPGQGGGYAGNNPRPGGPGQRPGVGYQGNNPRPGTPGAGPGGVRAGGGEVSQRQIADQLRATAARMMGGRTGGSRAKYSRDKRDKFRGRREEANRLEQQEASILKVTEFISAADLASLMDVSVNEVIAKSMGMGMFISINQRLDADAIQVLADEFGYEVSFTSEESEEELAIVEDAEEDLQPRAPIVTIMGHVDHGKTSLLDYIRKAKVAAGEAGGITQHIGAYNVVSDSGREITFLDTPGHEAFTAMRARGAKVTDVVIIVIAADDSVMPQTREAINHAQVAGVPMVFAFNKIDKPGANPEKIREELSQMNILVEEWGGKYQTQEISAKQGTGVAELMEKVLLEAELLELRANPDREAVGAVIEAMLDKGRGYVATMLVQTGTLKVGDVVLAGPHFGRVKAMMDHRGVRIKEAGPSMPVQVLGLAGAPQAGDKFNVMENERDAREIANRREQIQREQTMRTRKHITLDEIGRRLAIGTFKELNIIIKGDVDGSVEALSDSLLRLSTQEVQVNILHKGVGQISEGDVLLASASDAIIIGFQVRPSQEARRRAEAEEIEIRLYSIIYDAIDQIKDAMEGMLAPTVEESITGQIEVREVYVISKVGKVAGSYVQEGFVKRGSLVRVIRDGIVLHSGKLAGLRRFKDDVAEVKSGYECGITLESFSDIQVGDIVEAYEQKEVKRTLA